MNVQRSLVIPAFLSVLFISTLAAQAAGCYDMVRVDGIDPVTGFFKGPVYDGVLIGPEVPTSSSPEVPFNRYELVSDSGVVHSFDMNGNEIVADRIQLPMITFHPLTSITKGQYKGAAFIVVDGGDAYVICQGKIKLHIPHGQPPNGLPQHYSNTSGTYSKEHRGIYTEATELFDEVMVLGNDHNELVLVNLKTRTVKVYQLSHTGRGSIYSKPLVVKDEVYVTSTDGHIYRVKFDKTALAVLSKSDSDLGESIEASPVLLSNGEIAVGTRSGRVVFMRKDFGQGNLPEKNLRAYIGPNGLRSYGEKLLVSGQWGTQSVLGVVNITTKVGGRLNTRGSVAREVLLSKYNGKEIFIAVDELGNGYVTDTRLQPLGHFSLGENPASGPMNFGGTVRISTVSARLASLKFKSGPNNNIDIEY